MHKIKSAESKHAPYIGKAITMAIGDDLVKELAGNDHTPEDVLNLFSSLASRDDTQYSYLNALVAVDEEDNTLGVAVAYDGANLHKLRIPFFEEAEKSIGLKIKGKPADETGPEEFYLDTLAVFPQYRGRGIGSDLINAVSKKAERKGKPVGLLVSKTNPDARKLYDSLGFVSVGERPFAGEMMNHLMKN